LFHFFTIINFGFENLSNILFTTFRDWADPHCSILALVLAAGAAGLVIEKQRRGFVFQSSA
jgi:hypothetical protein